MVASCAVSRRQCRPARRRLEGPRDPPPVGNLANGGHAGLSASQALNCAQGEHCGDRQ